MPGLLLERLDCPTSIELPVGSLYDHLADAPPDFICESALLSEAFELARCAHHGQERKDPGSPYVVHSVLVAERLARHAYREEVVAAGLLHDVLERSDLRLADLAGRFGWLVADLVATLTDDPMIQDFVARKDAQRAAIAPAGAYALAIFAADRSSNAVELTRLLRTFGFDAAKRDKAWPETRLRLWLEDLEMLEERAPRLPLLSEMRTAIRA